MLHRRSLRDAANGHDALMSECTTLRHLCGLVLARLCASSGCITGVGLAEPELYQSNMLEIMHQAGILIISRVVELRWGEWKKYLHTKEPITYLPYCR